MKVSVVVPAYNEERLIARCLLSLTNQTFARKDYEIIVVDNASIDKTSQIAGKYADVVIRESKKGILFARQIGFEQAKGDVIIRTDADSFVPMDWIERAWKKFEKDKKMVALSGFYYPDDNKFWLMVFSKLSIFIKHIFFRLSGNANWLTGSCSAFRKNIFEKTGGFDLEEDPVLADQAGIAHKMGKYGRVGFDKDWWVWFSNRRVDGRKKRGWRGMFEDYVLYQGLNNLLFFVFKKYPKKIFGGGWKDFRD